MDFAENFSFSYDEEIQAAYLKKTMLHCIHVKYTTEKHSQDEDDEKDLGCRSYIAIADAKSHNASTVFTVLQHSIHILKQDLLNIRYIHYLTDSTTGQYSNVFITTMLLKHESMFQIRADWLFFEVGHGKSPLDGVGGVSQRHAEEAIKRKQVTVIDYAEYSFKWAQGDTTSKNNYFFVYGKADLGGKGQMGGWQRHREPNIMNVHSFMVKGPSIYARGRFCYNSCCYDIVTNTFMGK